MNKRPDKDAVKNLLGADQFGSSESAGISADTDPVLPSPMKLNLDQVIEYDRNPRRAENSERENIKNNFRERGGQTDTFNVTKRPGSKNYMLESGANTRLSVLRELYQETEDQIYYWLDCKFIPFESESRLMLNHLTENDIRGDYIFLDRAQGVRNLRDDIEEELGSSLSQRKLEAVLKERNYPVSRGYLYRMDYALDRLLPYCPVALETGALGSAQTGHLQQKENKLKGFWSALNNEPDHSESGDHEDRQDTNPVELFISQGLSELDSEEGIDSEVLQKQVLGELSSLLNLAENECHRLFERYISDPDSFTRNQIANNTVGGPDIDDIESNRQFPSSGYEYQDFENRDAPLSGRDKDLDESTLNTAPTKEFSVSIQRPEAYTAAKQFATSMGFADLVSEITWAHGFICDIPSIDQDVSQVLDSVGKQHAWWWLFSLSEITRHMPMVVSDASSTSLAPIFSDLINEYAADDVPDIAIQAISSYVGDDIGLPYRYQTLSSSLSSIEFHSLMKLISVIRSIKEPTE